MFKGDSNPGFYSRVFTEAGLRLSQLLIFFILCWLGRGSVTREGVKKKVDGLHNTKLLV